MKRFLLYTLLAILPIILAIGYYTCCIAPHEHRDLGSLGMIAFDDNYNVHGDTSYIPNIALDTIVFSENCKDAAIWVIGDSFSRSYISFNTYLAALYQETFYNYQNLYLHLRCPFQYLIYCLNQHSNHLPKLIIIESVERAIVYRLATLDFSLDTLPAYKKDPYEPKNMIARSHEFYKKRMNIDNPVKKVKLTAPFFTCKGDENNLYFYGEDIDVFNYLNQMDDAVVNLNKLRTYAAERGVELVFLIAADKYEIYRPYIMNNPYPEQNWLDEFVAKVNSPYLINSADTLRQMAANGMKDLYYCNDTHWSPVAAKAVADYMKRKMDEIGF